MFVFFTGKQRWTGVDRQNEAIETQYNGILQNLGISAPNGNDYVFFSAPGMCKININIEKKVKRYNFLNSLTTKI